MPLTPDNASDTLIDRLFDLFQEITKDHVEQLKADPTLAARLDADPELQSVHADKLLAKVNPELVFSDKPRGRAFDLHSEYTSYAPVDQRWSCIDLNTYSGAPDEEAPSNFIGRGQTDYEARQDLLAKFAEYDADQADKPKPRTRVIYSSGAREEPDDLATDYGGTVSDDEGDDQ